MRLRTTTRPIPKVSTNRRLWLCAMLVMSSRKVEWYPDADRCSCIRQLLRRFGRSSFGSSRQPTRFMNHNEFHVGLEFWCGGSRWRCTDIGSETVVAISLEPSEIVKIERVGSRTEEVRERRLIQVGLTVRPSRLPSSFSMNTLLKVALSLRKAMSTKKQRANIARQVRPWASGACRQPVSSALWVR